MTFSHLSYNNLKRRLSYAVSTGKLKKLRKGIYAKTDYHPFELATKIYTPSYISLETVLSAKGIIFQNYTAIFAVTYVKREVIVDTNRIAYRRLPGSILLNKAGVEVIDHYSIASKERAFLDLFYLSKGYHFDNLKPLNWDSIRKLQDMYQSKILIERVQKYYELFKKEYV